MKKIAFVLLLLFLLVFLLFVACFAAKGFMAIYNASGIMGFALIFLLFPGGIIIWKYEKFLAPYVIAIFLLGTIFVLHNSSPNSEKKAEAVSVKVRNAIVSGAPSITINGACVDGKIYVKDDTGNFRYLTVEGKPLGCQ